MTTEQKDAPKAVPPKAEAKPPMTEAQFLAELDNLFKRAEASNLSPVLLAARVGFRRGVGLFDGGGQLVEGAEETAGASHGSREKCYRKGCVPAADGAD